MELFRRDELLDWSEFEATFGPVLRDGIEDGPATAVFELDATLGKRQWEDFRKRVIEHVCSACAYTLYIDSMHAFHIQGYDNFSYSMELGINILSVRMKPKDKIYVAINAWQPVHAA